MVLNEENYFSKQANMEYLSVSQFKDFETCEAAAMAKLKGEWVEEENKALLVGSYFHSHFDGSMDKFKMEHPNIFTQKRELKAEYKMANNMIKIVEEDGFCNWLLQGESEVIFEAELYGAKWKCKMDKYDKKHERFIDLKTTKDFEKVWDGGKGAKVSFAEYWGYDIQIAMYREIEAKATGRDNRLEGLIIAVTKKEVPDKAILSVDLDSIRAALKRVEEYVPRILDLKAGKEIPIRCEKCDYCKSTKQLNRIVNYRDI